MHDEVDEQTGERVDSVDLNILAAMLDRRTYTRHKDSIKKYMVTKLSWELMGDIGAYYEAHPNENEIKETPFYSWFRLDRHSEWKPDKHRTYKPVLDTLFSISRPDDAVLTKIKQEETLKAIQDAADEGDSEQISSLLRDLTAQSAQRKPEDLLVRDSIKEAIEQSMRTSGLEWRLEDLNRSVGPLSMGDFILIGKRPETGGTSFLISEFTHMLHQLPDDKHVLIINNEEYKDKILTRLVQSALEIDIRTLHGDPDKYASDYEKFLGTKKIDLMSDSSISTSDIESVLASGKYGLIGINVLDKITGFGNKLEDYQRLEQLGQWGRKIATTYGPVFAIVQADSTAEGIKYMDQSQLHKSKTGLQSEADVLIMIGKSNDTTDPPEVRYLHVAKNKLPGSNKTEQKFRHIKSEVTFNEDNGRYTTRNPIWK